MPLQSHSYSFLRPRTPTAPAAPLLPFHVVPVVPPLLHFHHPHSRTHALAHSLARARALPRATAIDVVLSHIFMVRTRGLR